MKAQRLLSQKLRGKTIKAEEVASVKISLTRRRESATSDTEVYTAKNKL